MIQSDSMAAEILASGASAFSAYAANRLLEKRPEIESGFGEPAFREWKDHFRQRVLELSAAIAEQEPLLFTDRIHWSQAAFKARDVPNEWLKESLVCLREVVGEELPEASRDTACSYLDAAIHSLELPQEYPGFETTLSSLATEFLHVVLEGNSQKAIQQIVTAVDDGLPVKQAYQDVLLASQIEVGRMWHAAEINIAEEHFVTATTQRAMAVLGYRVPKKSSNGMTVIAAGVAGNIHDIGIRAISDFFEFEGWQAVCLGGDTPAIETALAVDCFGASLVLLSAALSTQIKSVRETIAAVRELDRTNCKIMVGGMAFVATPELWKRLGADGYAATVEETVAEGTRLLLV